MSAFVKWIAAAALLASFPAHAQGTQSWSKVVSPAGTVSLEFPCAQGETGARSRDGFEGNRCVSSGITSYLYVIPDGTSAPVAIFSSYDGLYAMLRDDPDTSYVNKTQVSGFQAFFGEGKGQTGKVGTAMIKLDEKRNVVLVVESDGSQKAEELLSDTFIRIWGSLQVIAP